MATLNWSQDSSRPGVWLVQANHPTALAAIPDALLQVLDLPHDQLAAWALHQSEQVGGRADAYGDERRELGPTALVNVVELLRPRQQNTVWIDRYHLVVASAPAAAASRLLGLYAGSTGSLLLYVCAPASPTTIPAFIAQAPHTGGIGWDDPILASQARFAVRYTERAPHQLQLVVAPVFAQQAQEALQKLAAIANQWPAQ